MGAMLTDRRRYASVKQIPAACRRNARIHEKRDDAMSGVSILVADDFAPWRDQARNLLQERPEWQVIEACNGEEAVQKAAKLHPDIILLDIGMPILNGLEAAEKIREAMPHSKIIFVTQDGDADVRAAALAAGAEDYLLKHNAATLLLPALETALRNRHQAELPGQSSAA